MISGKTEQAIFFGSGPVAAASLELLIEHTTVEAVVTKPRATHHRGSVPVVELAEARGLTTHTVSSKKELDQLIDQEIFTSRYGILIDFGIIVSRHTIDKFELGIINSHFSLLPLLRGADPITWSIANGDSETGASLMLIDEGMDTGQLIAQETLALDHTETTPTLTDSLITLSDSLLQDFVPQYLEGNLTPYDQPNQEDATYSRKLDKIDGIIDWSESAVVIERKIRAFAEWPQSRTTLGKLDVIITSAHVVDSKGAPGKYDVKENQLIIYAGDKALSIDTLKPAGKKEMPIGAFLQGYKAKL